jgi:hypothetical protein
MVNMKNAKHPNFILAIVSIIILLIGIGLRSNGYQSGDYIIFGGVALGAIHYIWSIIDVIGRDRDDLRGFQKRFWLILVIAVPAFGSLLFYIMHQQRDKIVT